MSIDLKQQIFGVDLQDLKSLATSLANSAKGGEVFELIGDLGAGKTSFVKAFVQALGSKDEVTSPTFSLKNHYNSTKLDINHFDLYRLDRLGEVIYDLQESISPDSVTFIEWAKDIEEIEVIKIRIQSTADVEKRDIIITAPNNFKYIVEGLTSI